VCRVRAWQEWQELQKATKKSQRVKQYETLGYQDNGINDIEDGMSLNPKFGLNIAGSV